MVSDCVLVEDCSVVKGIADVDSDDSVGDVVAVDISLVDVLGDVVRSDVVDDCVVVGDDAIEVDSLVADWVVVGNSDELDTDVVDPAVVIRVVVLEEMVVGVCADDCVVDCGSVVGSIVVDD